MYKLKERQIYASEIAEYLNADLHGEDVLVMHPIAYNNPRSNSIFFVDQSVNFDVTSVAKYSDMLIITDKVIDGLGAGNAQIICEHAKLDFLRVVNEMFLEARPRVIADDAVVAEGAVIGRNASIDSNAYIGPEVVIGSNASIMKNVVIDGPVKIGDSCVIACNAVIGGEGYSFVPDEGGNMIHCSHMGRIVIGDNVWIGAQSTVERAFLDDTVIGSDVKIDDLVNIGSCCRIGQGTMLTSGTVVSFSTVLGRGCWLAPNSSIGDGLVLGDNVTVGIGAVVIDDLEGNAVYIGNPARLLKKKGGV